MRYPQVFNDIEYTKWHESKFPQDKPLSEKITNLRNGLITNAKDNLDLLARIIEYKTSYCSNEYQTSKKVKVTYDTPLLEALNDLRGNKYQLIFKSKESIINKLWRKNKNQDKTISLENLSQEITDLIRTEIISSTLDSAKFLAERFESSNPNIYESKLQEQFNSKIDLIKFEPEMKMASGYFAYHGLVHFKDGMKIEIQIYSSLMKQWREMSHILYEKIRLKPQEIYEYGTSESRLISLGHLLHLAECEIQRLQEEFEKIT